MTLTVRDAMELTLLSFTERCPSTLKPGLSVPGPKGGLLNLGRERDEGREERKGGRKGGYQESVVH